MRHLTHSIAYTRLRPAPQAINLAVAAWVLQPAPQASRLTAGSERKPFGIAPLNGFDLTNPALSQGNHLDQYYEGIGIQHVPSTIDSQGMPPPPGSVSFTPAGNSCSDGCGITYPTTTTVTIQATTSPTMTFSGWDGACSSSGSNPTCTIEVGKPVLVNSSFSYNSSGTVSSQPRTTVTGQQFQATYRMNSIIVEQNGYGSSYSPTSGRISMDSSLGTSCFGYNRPDFSCNFTSPVAGTVVITGTYAGSRNFGPSTTVFTHTVTRADTALTITGATPVPSVTGQPIAVNYNLYAVYPGGGMPMGSITISSSDGASATCPVTSSTGSCSVAPLRTGTVTLTARYNGDANYNASQATTTSVVTKADTTTTISVTPSGFSEPY